MLWVMETASILIRRYARSRLYDPENRRYVTIGELRQWRRDKIPFVVIDSETGADITLVLLA
jgi:polyhydroxyalkanoate synthesis regulator protein